MVASTIMQDCQASAMDLSHHVGCIAGIGHKVSFLVHLMLRNVRKLGLLGAGKGADLGRGAACWGRCGRSRW